MNMQSFTISILIPQTTVDHDESVFWFFMFYGVALLILVLKKKKVCMKALSALHLQLLDQPGSPLLLSNMDEASLDHFNELLFSLLCPAYRRFA